MGSVLAARRDLFLEMSSWKVCSQRALEEREGIYEPGLHTQSESKGINAGVTSLEPLLLDWFMTSLPAKCCSKDRSATRAAHGKYTKKRSTHTHAPLKRGPLKVFAWRKNSEPATQSVKSLTCFFSPFKRSWLAYFSFDVFILRFFQEEKALCNGCVIFRHSYLNY